MKVKMKPKYQYIFSEQHPSFQVIERCKRDFQIWKLFNKITFEKIVIVTIEFTKDTADFYLGDKLLFQSQC